MNIGIEQLEEGFSDESRIELILSCEKELVCSLRPEKELKPGIYEMFRGSRPGFLELALGAKLE